MKALRNNFLRGLNQLILYIKNYFLRLNYRCKRVAAYLIH